MDQPDLDEVMLRLVFENREDFGGGVIDKLFYHGDSQCAVIVFKRPEGVTDTVIHEHTIYVKVLVTGVMMFCSVGQLLTASC